MEINGELVRKFRKKLGMTQEKFAKKIGVSEKTISRIENNDYKSDDYNLSIWKFTRMMELVGIPDSDFWVLYLTTEEYEGYKIYKKVQRFIDQDRIEESIHLLEELSKNPIAENSIVNQSIKHMKIIAEIAFNDATGVEVYYEEILRRLYTLLSVDYLQESKLLTQPLTQSELKILNHTAVIFYHKGDIKRSITLLESLYNRKGKFQMSEEDHAKMLPVIMANLANYLLKDEQFDKSLELATKALKLCKESKELWSIPDILLTMARLHKFNEDLEEKYTQVALQAYYSAKAMGRELLAKEVYDDFKNLIEQQF